MFLLNARIQFIEILLYTSHVNSTGIGLFKGRFLEHVSRVRPVELLIKISFLENFHYFLFKLNRIMIRLLLDLFNVFIIIALTTQN